MSAGSRPRGGAAAWCFSITPCFRISTWARTSRSACGKGEDKEEGWRASGRWPRRGGARARRGGRPGRRGPPRGLPVLRDRDPGRGEGAALHRRRRVLPRGRGPRGALRGARRARRGPRGRSGLPRDGAGAAVPRGARVSSAPSRGFRRALPRALLTLLLAWLVLYPIVVVVVEAGRGDAIATFLSRGGEWHAL